MRFRSSKHWVTRFRNDAGADERVESDEMAVLLRNFARSGGAQAAAATTLPAIAENAFVEVGAPIECLHQLFEEHADARPSAQAIVAGDTTLSYGQVDRRANQVAHALRRRGVGCGDRVGIFLRRSEKPIVAILGCLKAGVAYIPIDPSFPAERIGAILSDAGATALITERGLADRADALFRGEILQMDGTSDGLEAEPTTRIPSTDDGPVAADLCYLIYTSGTTGQPKGIMTEHRNAVSFVRSFNQVLGINASDRIYQGFSLAFDGSVEEMWMAFSNGATLVVGPEDSGRLGNEIARVLTENRVTVFSTVPTVLSMVADDLPTVRVLIVSGEACPPDLVERWGGAPRRLLNVYGPTEATVNSTAALCTPGRPVTIGRPLPGYETYVLDEDLQQVPEGEVGELYIGGPGVARGYLNRPELTARHFIDSPFDRSGRQRLYRTGDMVRLDERGNLLFLGRSDGQLKLRGYRVELAEIEAVIREHSAVRLAAVTAVDRAGFKELAAHVVCHEGTQALDADEILDLCRQRLPGYMIPGYLDVHAELPLLASGKVDRKRLPDPVTPLVHSKRAIVGPSTDLERKLASVWEEVLEISPISVEDDFFLDLGGYSLLAARAVTKLRLDHGIEVAFRDVYAFPTIRKLAAHAEAILPATAVAISEETSVCQERPTSRETFESLPAWIRRTTASLQALSLLVFYGLAGAPLLIFILLILGAVRGDVAVTTVVGLAVGSMLIGYWVWLGLGIALKWLVIGRVKEGSYPLWGFYYFRWWLAARFQAMSGAGLLSGTPFMSLYWRLMGAKVGRHTLIDGAQCAAPDLVSIGEDTSIGTGTQLLGYRVEDGMLHLGRVDIGSRCFVGAHCSIGLNAKMEDGALLDDNSLLGDGEVIPAGQGRRGSPAQPAEVAVPEIDEATAPRRRPLLWTLYHLIALEFLPFLGLLIGVPSLIIIGSAAYLGGVPWAVAAVFLSIPVSIVSYLFFVAGIKAILLRKTRPGTYSVQSWFYIRKWAVDLLLAGSRTVMHGLYTTIYLPSWLRMLGAKIGPRAEISTISWMTPDLTHIEEESFFADGSMIGGRRLYRGHIQLAENRIGRRSFVGNNAILPVGASLGNNCLLGVMSAPPADSKSTPEGSEWLGSPSFRLPHRKKVEGFDLSETYRPTPILYFQRFVIDGLRILIPNLIAAGGLIAFAWIVVAAFINLPVWSLFLVIPAASFGLSMAAALTVVGLKWAVMGRFKPVIKPLWSMYVWLNEMVNGAYETVAAPIVSPLMGTPFFNWFLRLMGCKIGKHVYLETTLFSEFDLVEIGDYAALNSGVVVQNHLFEDRIMKSSYQKIGEGCSVGNMAVVLYDTEMEAGSVVGPMSLLMKGERIPANSRWVGIPTRRVG